MKRNFISSNAVAVVVLLFAFLGWSNVNGQTSSSKEAQNLILNGGFEDWTGGKPDNWTYPTTTVAGASYAQESTIKVSGNYSVKLMHTGTKDAAKLVSPRINVVAGQEYTFTMDYYMTSYNSSGNINGIRYWGVWRDANENTINDKSLQPNYFNTPLNQWNNISTTVTAPTGAAYLDLDFRWYSQVTCYVDNISFTVKGTEQEYEVVTIPELKAKTPSSDIFYKIKNLTFIGSDQWGEAAFAQDALGNGLSMVTLEGGIFESLSSGDVFDLVAAWVNIDGTKMARANEITKNGTTAEIVITEATLSDVISNINNYDEKMVRIRNVDYSYAGDFIGKITKDGKTLQVFDNFFDIPHTAMNYINMVGVVTKNFDKGIMPRSIADFEINSTEPKITVSATALDFGNIVAGQSKQMTFTIKPENLTGNLSISSTGEGFSVSPNSIESSVTTATTITVTFSPTDIKSYTGNISISGGGLDEAESVSLTGVGINAPEPSQNLILNGGFESWTDGKPDNWTYTTASGASYAQESGIKVSGDYSIKLMHTGTSGTANFAAKRIDVVAGQEYTFSMDYYMVSSNTTAGKENGLRYWGTWRDAGGTAGIGNTVEGWNNLQMGNDYLPALPYGEWRHVNFTVTAPEGAAYLDMQIRWYNQVTCYVDNVTFTTGGSTTPVIVVNPTSLNFDEVLNGSTSSAKEISIVGNSLTNVISYTKEGADATAFTITEGDWDANTGGKLNVTFSPTEAKDYAATLKISSEGATDVVVALTGKGVAQLIPSIEISETALNFGDVIENKTKSMTFTITTKNLANDVTIAATGEGFTVSPSTITAATTATTTVTVTFAPTAVKAYEGAANITGGDMAEIKIVTLTGKGIKTPEQSQNLIVNGGFENWTGETLNNWTYTTADGASYAKESTIKVSGDYSVKLMHTGSKGTANLAAERIAITAGAEYIFSMDYYVTAYNTSNNNGVRYWGTWRDAEGKTVADGNLQPADSYLNTPINQWNNTTLTVVAPEGAVYLDMQIRWYNQVTCYVDNVSFTAVSTETIAAPTALAGTEIDSSSFVANWTEVEGATSYLLTVVNYDGDPILSNQVIDKNSFKVTGLQPKTEYEYYVKAQNANAISAKSNTVTVVTEPVGVNELESSAKIFVSNRTINIEIKDDANIEVINLEGKVISIAKGSSKISIAQSGVYFVRVSDSNNQFTKKVIVK